MCKSVTECTKLWSTYPIFAVGLQRVRNVCDGEPHVDDVDDKRIPVIQNRQLRASRDVEPVY